MPSPDCPVCITACSKTAPKCSTCKQRVCYACLAKLVKTAQNGWPVMRWSCPTCRSEIHALTSGVKNKVLLRGLLSSAEAHLREIDEDERMI